MKSVLYNYQREKKLYKNLFLDSDDEANQEGNASPRFVIPTLYDRQQLNAEIEQQANISAAVGKKRNGQRSSLEASAANGRTVSKSEYTERLCAKALSNDNRVGKFVEQSRKHRLCDLSLLDLDFNMKRVSLTQWFDIQDNIKLNVKYTGFRSIKPIGINKTFEECCEEQFLDGGKKNRREKSLDAEEPVGIFKLVRHSEHKEDIDISRETLESNDLLEESHRLPADKIPYLIHESIASDDEANQGIDFYSDSSHNNINNERSLFLESELENVNENEFYVDFLNGSFSNNARREITTEGEGPSSIIETTDRSKE